MMRSMFSGVSSLRAHQLRMDVIGNNIANVNTVGYKSSRVTFAETFSQTLQGASTSTATRGGTNPMQVGLGSTVSAISVNHTRGSIERTDVNTDLMIDGNGFFMVSSDRLGQEVFYTRAGNFSLDARGYLVNPDGMFVLDTNKKPIHVDKSATMEASASNEVTLSGNINAALDSTINPDADDYTMTVDLYDSLGRLQNVEFVFDAELKPVPTEGTSRDLTIRWRNPYQEDETAADFIIEEKITVVFDSKGQFRRLDPAAGDTNPKFTIPLGANNYGAEDLEFFIDERLFFNSEDLNYQDNGNLQRDGAGIVQTNSKPSISQYAIDSDARAIQTGGNTAGSISSFNISSKGEVSIIYTNGERSRGSDMQVIGLVDFDNPPGLMKIGGNLFQDTPNSGTPKYGNPGSSGFGSMAAGALEMSNVDIAAQFTDMITTQRGFQANSRVISTSDEILQELVNLKR